MKTMQIKWFNRLIPTLSVTVDEGEYDSGRHVALLIPLGLLYGLDDHPSVWFWNEK